MKALGLFVISPSRFLVELLRNKINGSDSKKDRGNLFRLWNYRFFIFEIILAVILCITTYLTPSIFINSMVYLLIIYSWSRVNEIAIAFYFDASWHLYRKPMATDLEPAERVGMALKSYAGLAINFAVIYYFLPIDNKFSGLVCSFADSLYFSVITITTLGYGDISPSHIVTRGTAVYEVITGVLVLVIAVSTYMGVPEKLESKPETVEHE